MTITLDGWSTSSKHNSDLLFNTCIILQESSPTTNIGCRHSLGHIELVTCKQKTWIQTTRSRTTCLSKCHYHSLQSQRNFRNTSIFRKNKTILNNVHIDPLPIVWFISLRTLCKLLCAPTKSQWLLFRTNIWDPSLCADSF